MIVLSLRSQIGCKFRQLCGFIGGLLGGGEGTGREEGLPFKVSQVEVKLELAVFYSDLNLNLTPNS
jgi:hypothetical protein